MSYSFHLYDCINKVPFDDWRQVCAERRDLFMDPRFIASVEESLASVGKYWCLLIRDEIGQPAACACISLYQLDLALLGQERLYRFSTSVRRIVPSFLKIPVLFCGLPVSAGQSHFCVAPAADPEKAIPVLDQALRQLARQHRALLIVLKEFAEEDRKSLDHLLALDYVRGDSFPMNHFSACVSTFDDFCESLRSHYRYKIRRSQRKFENAGFRVEHLPATEAIERYSDEAHRLYEAVVDQAEVKLERLPRAFFVQLARRLPEEVRFTAVTQEGRIVAFSWGLLTESAYQNLFIGLDYRFNGEADLYFNLMAQDLAYGICQGVGDIQVGQTADAFKSRLGCSPQPRYVYVKGCGLLLGWLVRKCSKWFFPPPPPPPPRDLFRR